VLALLILVFLPQVLSSKVGRKFVVSYISGKTNSPVTVQSFKTSWFGGTTIHYLSIADPMGRRIGCKSVTCQASLWNLLRGKYKLGDCVVDGLNFDYVVDDGRGVDTFEQMKGPPGPNGPVSITTHLLPNLSGKITINSGTIVLHRGTVQPKLYDTTWQQGRLENVEAVFDIQSLDKPWTYTFSADTVEGDQPRGSITSSGTIDLGENGQADAGQMKVNMTLSGENVRTGGLGAALIPAATPDDVRQALGPVLARIDVSIRGANGKLLFEKCDATGPTAQVSIRPAIDLLANPAVLLLENRTSRISLGVSKRFGQTAWVYLNPFLREAVGGRGVAAVDLEELRLPLVRQWARAVTARGHFSAKDVELERRDEMSDANTLPDNVASQLALLDGQTATSVTLSANGPFVVDEGKVSIEKMQTSIGKFSATLSGATELDSGKIAMSVKQVSSPSNERSVDAVLSQVEIPITGTIRKPQVGVLNVKGNLSADASKILNDTINQQITRMRARETQRLMQKSRNEVQEILRPLQPPPDSTGK
jgi:hypothetical protein